MRLQPKIVSRIRGAVWCEHWKGRPRIFYVCHSVRILHSPACANEAPAGRSDRSQLYQFPGRGTPCGVVCGGGAGATGRARPAAHDALTRVLTRLEPDTGPLWQQEGVFRHAERDGQSVRGTAADGQCNVSATRQACGILPDDGGGNPLVGSACPQTGGGLHGYGLWAPTLAILGRVLEEQEQKIKVHA